MMDEKKGLSIGGSNARLFLDIIAEINKQQRMKILKEMKLR